MRVLYLSVFLILNFQLLISQTISSPSSTTKYETECRKNFRFPTGANDINIFEQTFMFPILSSPGSDFTTDDLTLLDFQNLVNNGFSETLNLQIGNNSVVTFELGLNDMDVTCEEDFEIVAPNGDYTINGGVFGTPFPIFILDGVTQTGPAFSKKLDSR